jgi:hypothetical protein
MTLELKEFCEFSKWEYKYTILDLTSNGRKTCKKCKTMFTGIGSILAFDQTQHLVYIIWHLSENSLWGRERGPTHDALPPLLTQLSWLTCKSARFSISNRVQPSIYRTDVGEFNFFVDEHSWQVLPQIWNDKHIQFSRQCWRHLGMEESVMLL